VRRKRMRQGLWMIVAVLLTASATTASADEGSPHRLSYGVAVANTGVWANRDGDGFACSVFGFGCSYPQRPLSDTDFPVANLTAGEQVTIRCFKGSYYLVEYDSVGRRSAWAVADVGVRPIYGNPDECTILDDVT
jgi:hypothetical protein